MITLNFQSRGKYECWWPFRFSQSMESRLPTFKVGHLTYAQSKNSLANLPKYLSPRILELVPLSLLAITVGIFVCYVNSLVFEYIPFQGVARSYGKSIFSF